MADPEKKSRREFQCRDDLWELFGTMAAESGFPRDALLNEAMKHFARSRGYLTDGKRAPREDSGLFEKPPPTAPRRASPPPPPAPSVPKLFLYFNGQRYAVDPREDFIIGRASSGCHLTIKDVNVSRRHAAIAYRNGSYYLQDLGSMNGIDHKGERVDHKRIEEGDLFHICDYELRFTFQER
jgi:hypothetical protein